MRAVSHTFTRRAGPGAWAFAALLILSIAPGPAAAQEAAERAAPAQAAAGSVETDLLDLIRRWRHRPEPAEADARRRVVFLMVPLIGAKPTTGLRIGAGASIEFPLGDPATTRISAITTGAMISTKKQFSVSMAPTLYGPDNAWQLDSDDHFSQTQTRNGTLGTESRVEPSNVNYDSVRFFNTYSRRFAPSLYAGLGIYYAAQRNIAPASEDEAAFEASPFVTYSREHGFDLSRQVAAGPGATLVFDNRDVPADPSHGSLASATFRVYVKDFLGGDSNWNRLTLDVRTYRPLTRTNRHTLALWGYGDFVTAGTAPYLSLPMTGGDPRGRSGRGYAEGQFRGERLVYAEAEYRATLTANGLFGMTLFANLTTAASLAANERLFDSVAPGGGAGLRLLLQKRSRTNLCFDFGFGRAGSFGFYVGLAEAF